MRLPDFLIIGAMKSGTTTLYRDLLAHPDIFMPAHKEPSNLCHDHVLDGQGLREYAHHFELAKSDQLVGEASTHYSKLPDYPGVPKRARQLLGSDIRIIYIVRNPVDRIISQHYHHFANGDASSDINKEVREKPRYLNWSRYAMQVQPWIETFSREQVLILRFEEYTRQRAETVSEVCTFLGVAPRPDVVDEQAVYNRSESKPVANGFWMRILRMPMYRKHIQKRLPMKLRDTMRGLFFPKAPERPAPPSDETVQFILDELREDMETLQEIVGPIGESWLSRLSNTSSSTPEVKAAVP